MNRAQLNQDGFHIARGVLNRDALDQVCRGADESGTADKPNKRNLLSDSQVVADISLDDRMTSLVQASLGADAFPVRALWFNKSNEENWPVAWHQDLTIAVDKQVNLDGFSNWTEKQGVTHVEPPVEILESMLTIRMSIDPSDASNGGLHVLPGSHKLGRVLSSELSSMTERFTPACPQMNAGDVLIMHPLLIHSSPRSQSESNRRVLHIEYCNQELPEGLNWYFRRPKAPKP